jgi:putative ABC transport system permease protein
VLRPFAGALAPTVASVMGRDRRALARGAGFIALTVAFAVSTAVFNSTYRQQARVDAVLTNGADVRVTVPAGADAQVGPALDALSGVRHVEPVQRRFAYVGSDLQDLFGVKPSTITTGTSLDDAYFSGGTAQEVIQRLAATPDGILVSAETVQDFQLRPGDALKLRLVTGTGDQYVEATFHYVGIAKEFPTAPRDSFLVANASYIAQASGRSAADTFLVTTDGTPPAVVAGRVRDVLGPAVQVTSLDTVQGAVGSSLVAVDLHGLTTLELALAVLLAAAGAGLTLWLAVHQRRRTLALAQVVGARPRQVTGLVAAEAGFVTVAGLLAGAALGWVLSNVLVDVLSGVFDPAPHQLAVPWAYLGAVMAAIVISVVAAVAATGRAAAAPPTALLRGS